MHVARHAPVERRRVNDDGQIRLTLVRLRGQFVKQAPDRRQMAEDFRDSDYRKIFGIDHSVATRSPHAVPAHAKEFQRLT